jgi:hypothetical protein
MAKFKVGDRCRIVYVDSGDRYGIGDIVTVDQDNSQAPWIRLSDGSRSAAAENQLELIQDHQPITPKVGERYRVVKKLPDTYFNNPLNVMKYVGDCEFHEPEEGLTQCVKKKCLTTEFLELVEEPQVKRYMTVRFDLEPVFTDRPQPIKQSLITKSMNFIKKLTQSAADKTLEKANFVNSCGELTATGRDAMLSLVFQEKKEALVKLAQEVIDEEKE